MAQKEKLISLSQQMVRILTATSENQNEHAKTKTDEDREKLIQLALDIQQTAASLPNPDRQSQNQGFLGSWSPFSSKRVQVFMPIPTSSLKEFAAALSKLCKDLSYKCELSDRVNVLQSDLPLVVVCPITSRLEPDIDLALQGLNWSSAFIALVLHSGNESSLPRLPTATQLPEKEKYRHAEFIDIAFTNESKLYHCQMNGQAKEKIRSFLDRYYKK